MCGPSNVNPVGDWDARLSMPVRFRPEVLNDWKRCTGGAKP